MKHTLLVSTALVGALAFGTAASARNYDASHSMRTNDTTGYSAAAVNNDTTGSVDTNLHRNFQVHDSALGDTLSSGGATGTTGGSAKGNVRHMTVGSQGNSLITVGAANTSYRDNYGYRATGTVQQESYTTGSNAGPYGYSGTAAGNTGGSAKNNIRDYSVGADGNAVTRSTADTYYGDATRTGRSAADYSRNAGNDIYVDPSRVRNTNR